MEKSLANRPRLVPDEPLPPYAFVPGQQPHPVSDPKGHSYGVEPAAPPPLDPERWQESRAYLFGFDLFNHQFYWEAHEQWEGLWHACGRQGATATLLKALIQLAVAGVKVREGRPVGVRSHALRAAELLKQVAREVAQERYLGLELAEVRRQALAVFSDWSEPERQRGGSAPPSLALGL